MEVPQLTNGPAAIEVQTEDSFILLSHVGAERWVGQGIEVECANHGDSVAVTLYAPQVAVQRVHLRWLATLTGSPRLLGDHWERGYGDLEWRGVVPHRVMPWYFLSRDARDTHGFGVKTGAASMAFWRADSRGVSLWLDVRCGGRGVCLGERRLVVAQIVQHAGTGETPFQAARSLCRKLSPAPRMPDHIVYGGNNWYYAYGDSSHRQILQDTRILLECTAESAGRPYMVIDAGWQHVATAAYSCCGGPWDRGNGAFPDMPGLADAMRRMGVRPGIWIRPLAAELNGIATHLLSMERAVDASAKVPVLDPSIPEVLQQIEADFARLHQWGYELIKHDWTTCDIFGRWGFDMGHQLTNSGWSFADRSRTTAEIINALYRAIRRGAQSSVVIGCNTVGHLGAGLFELQRTGDDTSGKEWERTRKMGINTLAFRMCQHGTFFAADADCVGLTTQVPWNLNRQWLELLAGSGTPLFVSAAPDALGAEQRAALKRAFGLASRPMPVAEPHGWLENTCPDNWTLNRERRQFDWYGHNGSRLG